MPSEARVTAFWSRVSKTDDCWLWTAAVNARGYGVFWADGKTHLAHRFAYALTHLLDAAEVLDHRCHNHACVNPEHLRVVTHKQNLEHRSGIQSNNTSGVRGVDWDAARGKWRGKVTHNTRTIHVGQFDTLAEAKAAVIAKRNELFTHNDLDRTAI